MIGRNDPCPCGSGKKYKKCHGKNAQGDITTLVSEEIDRIVEGFVKESFNPADYRQLEKRNQVWRDSLQQTFSIKLIDKIAMETYIYIDHLELWQSYINQQLTLQTRKQVSDILTSWLKPIYMLAKVDAQTPETISITDMVTNKSYVMSGTPSKTFSGNWLFGIFMPDARQGENGLTATSSVVFIPEDKENVTEILCSKLQNGYKDSLDLYQSFVEEANIPVEEAAQEIKSADDEVASTVDSTVSLSPFTTEVLTLTDRYLTEHKLVAPAFIELLTSFLEETAIKAKKAETVAAGAVLAGQANGEIPEGGLVKVKDVAGYFNVSASSISKYRDQISEYMNK
ncbi:SEC-C metal-binding domain-containing protein [Rummeliibacillus sp. G93]|uniref:YecA family protein n=1 Tax=Rummeliibacillus sp. G93 TaxID=2939494 RepID=UPI00201BEA3A|nr:SEC-C metal-binding domain-containing protein [Rummeliibacillus sp. G93]UQW97162.1 SEC-C metal-binding domain-containing protein [Rummeliibacillus sp. G93]